jgi:hypothetical protein
MAQHRWNRANVDELVCMPLHSYAELHALGPLAGLPAGRTVARAFFIGAPDAGLPLTMLATPRPGSRPREGAGASTGSGSNTGTNSGAKPGSPTNAGTKPGSPPGAGLAASPDWEIVADPEAVRFTTLHSRFSPAEISYYLTGTCAHDVRALLAPERGLLALSPSAQDTLVHGAREQYGWASPLCPSAHGLTAEPHERILVQGRRVVGNHDGPSTYAIVCYTGPEAACVTNALNIMHGASVCAGLGRDGIVALGAAI